MSDDDDDDLFAWARRHDPETAHIAADRLTGSERLARLFRFICDMLARHPEGLTTTEIARLGGLPRDSISPRMTALKQKGQVVDSGETRIPAGMHRRAIVWKLTGAAHG